MTVPAKKSPRTAKAPAAELPYKVICISIYNTDLEALDRKVAELKERGFRKANRSLVIRMAMNDFDPETVEIPEVQ